MWMRAERSSSGTSPSTRRRKAWRRRSCATGS
ncbi:hypothetical protein CRUP_001786 [Coryphaenoides rupestris]|nr:hypothetical protein CRUP_001786 [Coryphaenoides rupestris]